ncbi:MAG: rhodanese-related sulfurtransferase [Chlamydiia bacterium]
MSTTEMFKVLAYYAFTKVDDPQKMIKDHKRFLESLEGKGRIYISEEGINGQCSVPASQLEAYSAYVLQNFPKADIKIHDHPAHPFAKLIVKYRVQLVAMDQKVDMSIQGVHLDSKDWEKMLAEKDDDTIVIDTRNDYEWEVGHFEGALLPKLDKFREFPEYAADLKKEYDTEKTKVMMYCTGGIRCELYSSLMIKMGFKNVYQLNGGIIRYGLENGNKKWNGKLFVFDDRMVIPISKDEAEPIAKCQFCSKPADNYYNCANMDCNDLILSCPECIEAKKGCCSETCLEEGRVRPFSLATVKTPFRKLSHEAKQALTKDKQVV